MFQIRLGFENGLTWKQVEFYAKPRYDKFYDKISYTAGKMCQIRLGFKNKLTWKQVEFYAGLEHNTEMEEMRLAFEKGWTWDQVKILKMYADGDYYLNKMSLITWAFEEGLTVKDLSLINPEMSAYEIEKKIEKLINNKKEN
jgi:hypothetical protein